MDIFFFWTALLIFILYRPMKNCFLISTFFFLIRYSQLTSKENISACTNNNKNKKKKTVERIINTLFKISWLWVNWDVNQFCIPSLTMSSVGSLYASAVVLMPGGRVKSSWLSMLGEFIKRSELHNKKMFSITFCK